MIEAYKKDGRFPASFAEDRHFKGPIQCHLRPRRLYTLLLTLVSSYINLPPVFKALYALFSSGLLSAMIGVFFLSLRNIF